MAFHALPALAITNLRSIRSLIAARIVASESMPVPAAI